MTDLIMRLLFVAFALGLGGTLFTVGVREIVLQRRALAHIAPIEATIIESRVHKSVSRDSDPSLTRNTSTTSYRPEIRFRYEFAGQTRESDMLRPTIIVQGFADHDSAAEVIAAYPVGRVVTAHVDRTNPERAFLDPTPSIAPVIFVAVGSVLFVLAGVLYRVL